MEETYDIGGYCNGRPVFSDVSDVMNFHYWLFVLASPSLYATLTRAPVPAHLIGLVDIFILYATRDSRYAGDGRTEVPYERREPLARKLRARMETWTPPELPPEIAAVALEILESEGLENRTYQGDGEPVEDILLWPEGIPRLLREEAAHEEAAREEAPREGGDEAEAAPSSTKTP